MIKKALLLAGGKGTRLNCGDLPKPLYALPENGKPILEIILEKLKDSGIEEAVISIGFLGEKIQKHFGEQFKGMKIEYAESGDTVGESILIAKEKLEDSFVMMYADEFFEENLKEFLEYHKKEGRTVTIAVKELEDTAQYGVIKVLDDKIFFIPSKDNNGERGLADAGIYVVGKDMFEFLKKAVEANKAKEETDNEFNLVLKILADHKEVSLYPLKDYWIDIGTPERYKEACKKAKELLHN